MTHQRITLPDVSDEVNGLLGLLLRQLAGTEIRNLLRLSYYDTKRTMHDVARVIPPMYREYALCLGWSAKAVDGLARRANLDAFTWADGNLDSIGYTEWFDKNAVSATINRSIIDSLIFGPAFLIASKGGDGEPTSLLTTRDALDATGIWNGRTRSLDVALSIDDRDERGKILALSLFTDGQTLVAQRATVTDTWDVEVTDHPGLGILCEPLPYRPHGRRALGRSRISRPIMSLQDAAIRALTRLEGHMDVYSFPDYWMLGADESIFKNADGSQKTAWQIRLGRIKGIPDDDNAASDALARADVKQFTGNDPTPQLADINALAKMFAREASLPDTAVAITDLANPTSADAYDASQYELIAEAEGAIDDWQPSLRRTALKSLAIQNGLSEIPPEWSSIDTKFRDPRFQSRAAQADAGSKQIAAIPWLAQTEVGLELLGLDPQQIKRAMADQRRAQGTQALQQLLSDAASKVTAGGSGPTTH